MALQPGDEINRIGDEPVKGVVLSVSVDLGQGGPGNVVEVQVGNSTQSVFDESCGRVDRPISAIGRDGATMPSGSGADPTASHLN